MNKGPQTFWSGQARSLRLRNLQNIFIPWRAIHIWRQPPEGSVHDHGYEWFNYGYGYLTIAAYGKLTIHDDGLSHHDQLTTWLINHPSISSSYIYGLSQVVKSGLLSLHASLKEQTDRQTDIVTYWPAGAGKNTLMSLLLSQCTQWTLELQKYPDTNVFTFS